jgi:peptide/nickel transport system substrate-binding protein
MIRIGDFIKPTEINPITTDSSISALLLELVFDNLVRFDAEGRARPELAERWGESGDGLTLTFHLRPDVRFHDGTPLTARDVRFTYEGIVRAERGGNSPAFDSVLEMRVVDERTLQIVLSRPDSLLWDHLAHIGIAPRHLLEGKADFAEFNRHPVGSGPYRFVSQDEKEIVLEANEAHWAGRPRLGRVVAKILPSQKAGLTNLIAGNVDLIFLLNPNDFGALAKIPSLKTYENWTPILYLVQFNLKNALLKDPEVRRALNYAADKAVLIDRVLEGKGTAAASSFDLDSADLDPEVSPYPYRPDLAVRMLKERGWRDRDGDFVLDKDGKRFEFGVVVMEGDDVGTKALTILQEQWRKIGVRLKIDVAPFDVYAKRVFQDRDFDGVFIFFVSSHLRDNNFGLWHSTQIEGGFNASSYGDPEVDRALEAARRSADPAARRRAFFDFQKAVHENPPGVFLFWRRMPIAVHERFRGIPEKRMEMRDLVRVWESP